LLPNNDTAPQWHQAILTTINTGRVFLTGVFRLQMWIKNANDHIPV